MNPNNQPATPAQAATPGAQEQNGTSQPAPSTPAAPAAGGVPNNQDGKVTIDLKEYRNLQRQDARAKAYEKRFGSKKPGSQAASNDQGGTVDEQVIAAQAERDDATRRALQSEVRYELSNLVNREEYKNIPQSTKELLLKNPSAITSADNLDDALFDVEEWLNDQASKNPAPTQIASGAQPPKHETPPVVSGGAPAPAGAAELEDVSKLHGPLKTQAMIRNAIKVKGRKG